MKRPRFTLRFFLVVVTIAAVGLGVGRKMLIKRPITVKETETVAVEMSPWQVRWRLGAPAHVGKGRGKAQFSHTFDYADSEERPFDYFEIHFNDGRVSSVREGSYISGEYKIP